MKKFGMVLFSLMLALCAGACANENATLHANAEAYTVPYNGPFVKTDSGAFVGLTGTVACRSTDKGANWETFPAIDPEKYDFSDYSIVKGNDGTIVAAFCNGKEIKPGKWGEGSPSDWEIPVYSIYSTDDGKTWSEPLPIQRDWVGALRAMVTMTNGRIVLATMAIQPWNHFIKTYTSDDNGKSWTKTADIMMDDCKINDHDGALEPKLVQKKDGSLYMLIRTTKGTFYRSISTDGGETWSKPESTGIENNNSFGELAVLSDGRWVLLWNRDENLPAFNYVPDPNDWVVEDLSYSWIKPRNKLSIAFSADDGETWSEPVQIAESHNPVGEMSSWLAYSVFFEPEPGLFWITTQQGGIKMQIQEKNLQ